VKLPLFTVLYDGLIGKLMGENGHAASARVWTAIASPSGGRVFFLMSSTRSGRKRSGAETTFGEIRRVLNLLPSVPGE